MFIETVPQAQASGATAEYFAQQRQAWGFLPAYVQCFASRPQVAQAWVELAGTVRASMDRRRFELVTIAAAVTRRSTYCAVAHARMLRDVCDDASSVQAVAADLGGGALEPADRAVYRFAALVAADPTSVTEDDIDAVRAHGLSDAEVADITYAVGVRLFFTTVLDALGAQLDAELASSLDPAVLAALTVGRPPAEAADAGAE